jgi:pSer/pThr/pTyr-binding forkhead associated (FHA) protein
VPIIKTTCKNPKCGASVISNSDKWDIAKEIVIIKCPKCNQPIEKHHNPKFTKKGTTDYIHHSVDSAGWLVDKSSKSYYELKLKKQTVGRKSSFTASDVLIETNDLTISGAHCLIDARQQVGGAIECLISDNNSKNGLIINKSKRMSSAEVLHLKDGDVVGMGDSEFIFLSIHKAKTEVQVLSWIHNNLK